MQTDQQIFPTTQNPAIENSQHFGNEFATAICDLSQYTTLRVSGSDAQSFLQSLLSNDIKAINATQAQRSSFNSAKGRILATFLIWRDNDDYLLQLPTSLAEGMRKKLSMYVLRAKVTITNSGLISLGLSGDLPQQLQQCSELPQMGTCYIEALATRMIRLDDKRFMLSITPELAPALWQTLLPLAKSVDNNYWDWLDIRAGIPTVLPQTQEQFVPQMANLDLVGAINFKKGCYPGQEIVARMHYLGKLKRRMYLAHVKCSDAPLPGDELYSEEMAGQACGMIANAAQAPDGGYDVLAVVQIESRNAHPVHLRALQGETLAFEALPYSLPSI
jgi:folate-binding protein YgfZ